jgi:anti-anti-sigma factor
VLDPATGALSYCTAGHPPPLVLPVGTEAVFLPPTGAGPLGVGGSFPAEAVSTATVDPGAMLLLYTDGVLERPGRSMARSTVELAQTAADIAADRALRDERLRPVERLSVQTLELLTRATGHSDDITLLAAHRTETPVSLAMRLPAVETRLRDVRRLLADWMAGFAVSAADSVVVQHVVSELAVNAMTHAYVGSAAPDNSIDISGRLLPSGELRVEVRDHGRWREPEPSPDRGLGLTLAARLADRLQLTREPTGTIAVVEHRLSQPARLLTVDDLAAGRARPVPQPADPFLVIDQPAAPGPRVRVDGPVDSETAERFADAVQTAGAGGLGDLTVDLTGVTLLTSAGVGVLYRIRAQADTHGGRLRLYAPPGSTADMIMSLVGLDHLTTDPG